MNFRRAARAALAGRCRVYSVLAITVILAGLSASCGSSSKASSASHLAFVSLPQKGNIVVLHLNNETGAVSVGAQTPPIVNTDPTGLALDSSRKFLYVGNAGANTISIFTVASDGALTQTGVDTPVIGPRSLVIDPSGKYLLVTSSFADIHHGLLVFATDSASGALTPVGEFAANSSPTDLKISAVGNFVYVSNSDTASITGFVLNPDTGNLTSIGSPFSAGAGVAGLAIDSAGHFLYAANHGDGTVSAYTINPATGALSPVFGGLYPAGTGPRAIAIDPLGAFLYVTNEGSSNVSQFTVDGATGQLTTITTAISSGTAPVFALADPGGKFLYVGNQTAKNISGYSYDATTGKLTAISGSPFTLDSAPGGMVIP